MSAAYDIYYRCAEGHIVTDPAHFPERKFCVSAIHKAGPKAKVPLVRIGPGSRVGKAKS